ncbi:hypothetical protein CDD83_4294 [Cordyceps sp. RAO-2017]|nr:hypothetical protein CDD83_4294 [Cordyceps sp. RAO-2017]
MAAAGRERRAERLNERLRGAQRVNLGDDSFNLDIDGLDPPEPDDPPSPTVRVSARKRKRGDQEGSKDSRDGHETQRSTPNHAAESPRRLSAPLQAAGSATIQPPSPDGEPSFSLLDPGHDTTAGPLEMMQAPASSMLLSPVRSRPSVAMLEEVEESPAHAPGSGQRRRLQVSVTATSTARLHSMVSTDGAAPPSSSPLAQKARRSDIAASVRARRSATAASQRSVSREIEEPSLDQLSNAAPEPELPPLPPVDRDTTYRGRASLQEEEEEEAEPSGEEAEEIDVLEAAEALRKRRPRTNVRTSSPELGSGPVEVSEPGPEPGRRRIRPRPGKSPAVQKQPARRPKPQPQRKPAPPEPKQPQQRRDGARSEKAAARRQRKSEDDDEAVEITVQRFINNKRRDGDGSGDGSGDPLQDPIPFANRSGESVVDVLGQVCEEVIAATLMQLQQLSDSAEGAARKKECRIKVRAIEAYREELRSRLLQHTIHLNHWHSLRRQVRQAQKERLELRDEILRLGGEREQVALRMDAVRSKHLRDSRESRRLIGTSTLLHDMDLAVERGREAAEPPRHELARAELANLELLAARVADEASSGSPTGGMLHQVREFNGFLERAAQALESRR